jgi:fibronectin-binding autotransporter adhesin
MIPNWICKLSAKIRCASFRAPNRRPSSIWFARPRLSLLEDRVTPATLFAVDSANQLLRFDSATPGTIDHTTSLTGVTSGQSILGIAFRPATGELYAIGENAANTFGQIYTINTTTGVATLVGSGFALPQASGAAAAGVVGFAFNPTVDRIRITNSGTENFRVDPDTGAIAGVDTTLSSANIDGTAYTNNVGTATSTTLYGLAFTIDSLVTIGGLNGSPSPNSGTVTTVGATGLVTTSQNDYLAIEGDNGPGNNNSAWAALDTGTTSLYTIDLTTGAATPVGLIGTGTSINGFAVQQPNAPKVVGSAGNDQVIITATGTNSGVYQLFTNGVLVRTTTFSGITSFTFIGGAGDDTFTINNLAGTLFAPVNGIVYDGQGQTTGDILQNLGGGSASFNASYTPTGANSGVLSSTDGVITQTITFSGLEPVSDTSSAATFVINATSGDEQINVVDGPSVGGFVTTQVNSGSSGTFELVNFANKINVTIDALAGIDTVTLNNPNPAAGLSSLKLDTGDGNDIANVLTTPASVSTTVTSTTGAGTTDTVSVGNANSVQGILGALSVNNTTGFSKLSIDDTADATLRTVTMIAGSISGLAPATIFYNSLATDTLTINGGSGGNTFTVNSTLSGTPGTTIVNSGDGNDTFNITGNALGATSVNNFNGQGGSDSFNVNTMPLAGVTLNIDGGAGVGSDVLSLFNDSFTNETITPTGPGAGTIQFDALMPITFGGLEPINDTVSVATLTINATATAEEINVVDGPVVMGLQTTQVNSGASATFELVNFANKPTVTVNGLAGIDTVTLNNPNPGVGLTSLLVDSGDGNDIISVLATPASVSTTVTSTTGAGTTDTVNVGNANSVQSVLGALTIKNMAGLSNVNINDSADPTAHTATLTNNAITGLAPATINYQTGEVDTLTINGGDGGNTFNINSTLNGTPGTTVVNSGAGNDTLNIDGSGLGANSVNNLNGQDGNDSFNVNSAPAAGVTVTIDGGANTDTLTGPAQVNSWNLTAAAAGNITGVVTSFVSVEQLVGGPSADTLIGLNSAATWNITGPDSGNIAGVIDSFTGMENLTGGTDADNFVFVNATANITGTIDGGAGTDLLDYSALTTSVSANLGISTTNSASLDGTQEVPANASTATGTAAFTFNAATRTFDISLTVIGIMATDAQLVIQLQRAFAGVNGPVIITLFSTPGTINLGTFTPNANGFTFTATGIPLPGDSEAAFLGDDTYLNVQSTAFAGGEIRGQIIRQTQSASTTGTATGTGSIAGIENLTGGSAADSLVGSSGVNTIIGNAGNNTILGGQGNDQLTGGANDDLIIWANGDGSDVMDGGTGTDTVQVNGSVGASGDAFLVQPGVGGRLSFQRTNLGLFTLDIGTVESLTVNGNNGSDTFTVNDLTGVLDLTTVNLNGDSEDDTFNVTASSSVTFNVDGDQPVPPATPGDALNVTLTGATTPSLSLTSSATGLAGSYTFGNRQPVNFGRVETLSPAGTDLSITVTNNQTSPVPGTDVTYTIVVTNNGPLAATGAKVADTLAAFLTGVTFTAVQTGGATGFTANGTGAINDTVNMPVGSMITYTVTGHINPSATGNLDVTATVTAQADQPDPDLTNNTATDSDALMPQADVSITITGSPNPVTAGFNLTYTITVSTAGPSDAQSLNLMGSIPLNATFVSFSAPAGWTTSAPAVGGTGDFSAMLATLAAGSGSQVFTLVVHIDAGTINNTVISNNVLISSTTTDPVAGNNSATAMTTVVTPPPVIAMPLPIITGADAGGGPHVEVFDPITGALRFSFYAYEEHFTGGVRVAAADVTGDGVPDIITGAGPGGGPHVKVFDGVTGAEVRTFFAYDAAFRGGVFVAGGDINGDGFADIITGADAGGGPHVEVFSGKDGSLLASYYAYDPAFTGGVRVAGGDVDGDGLADVITGAGPGGGPQVIVFSGANNSILRSFYAYDPAFTGGVYVSAGDIDQDGHADIITGAGAGGTSQVIVYSGMSGAILHSFLAFDPAFTGGVRVGVADFGGDGKLDILTGAGTGGVPVVSIFNGANQNNVSNFFAYDPAFMGGVFVG